MKLNLDVTLLVNCWCLVSSVPIVSLKGILGTGGHEPALGNVGSDIEFIGYRLPFQSNPTYRVLHDRNIDPQFHGQAFVQSEVNPFELNIPTSPEAVIVQSPEQNFRSVQPFFRQGRASRGKSISSGVRNNGLNRDHFGNGIPQQLNRVNNQNNQETINTSNDNRHPSSQKLLEGIIGGIQKDIFGNGVPQQGNSANRHQTNQELIKEGESVSIAVRNALNADNFGKQLNSDNQNNQENLNTSNDNRHPSSEKLLRGIIGGIQKDIFSSGIPQQGNSPNKHQTNQEIVQESNDNRHPNSQKLLDGIMGGIRKDIFGEDGTTAKQENIVSQPQPVVLEGIGQLTPEEFTRVTRQSTQDHHIRFPIIGVRGRF